MRSLVTAGAPATPSQSSPVRSGPIRGNAAGLSNAAIWRNLLLTLPFLVFFYIQLAHHAMWRDELNAFGIAAGSPSVASLLSNVRYEGHPWLWYVLLWCISKITHDPVAMKWLQAVIGTGIYLVLGLLSPFRWWEKLLIFLSYYVIFEYTVMSRMYGLVLLFALLYCRERTRTPERPIVGSVLLGLMASADATGVLLSFAFVSECLYRLRMQRVFSRSQITAAVVYLAFLCTSVLSMVLPKDRGTQTSGALFGSPTKYHFIKTVLDYVAVTYLPTFVYSRDHYWGATAEIHKVIFTFAVPIVLLLYWFSVRRHRHLVVLLGTTLLLMIVFGYLVYTGSPRHFGISFVALLACLWILRSTGEGLPWASVVLLAFLVVAGVHGSIVSWYRPFSNTSAAAAWIRANNFQNTPLLGTPDWTSIGVAEQLGRPLYSLECHCRSSFVKFSNARIVLDPKTYGDDIVQAQQAMHTPTMLLIASAPLTPDQETDLKRHRFTTTPLQAFTGSEVWPEDFYLYRLVRNP